MGKVVNAFSVHGTCALEIQKVLLHLPMILLIGVALVTKSIVNFTSL